MSLVLFVTTATSTSTPNSTRFCSMLRWARSARPAQPGILGMSSRFPTSFIRPTWLNAPITATSTCTTVSAAAHTSRFSSGFIAPPFVEQRYVQLGVQAAHAEGDILARERGEIQIDAQHLLSPIRRFEGERQRHA